ncbi:hypothetical protein [Deinococcus radiophilus]|uniref:hypothetical protein n=1 Tax=Deinococcus radiophilus TaxID=32062 RepID=UPI0036245091
MLAVLISLVGCVNYDLSLGYALTFLLAGVWVTSAAYAARQAREVEAQLAAPAHGTVGETAPYQIAVRRQGAGLPFRAEVTGQGGGRVWTVPAQTELDTVTLDLPLTARGEHHPRVTLSLHDPLGLWRVIRPLHPRRPLLVWPRPEAHPPAPPQEAQLGADSGTGRRVRGDAEFSGLRPYQAGDTPGVSRGGTRQGVRGNQAEVCWCARVTRLLPWPRHYAGTVSAATPKPALPGWPAGFSSSVRRGSRFP